MAIKKKGNVGFLTGLETADIDTSGAGLQERNKSLYQGEVRQNTDYTPKRAYHQKDIRNWGRPRKVLIEGVKEKSITVQLPVTLISAMRKESKITGKSMKMLIGSALLEKYGRLI